MFKGVIPFAHHLLKEVTTEGDIVLDATCGNGNDTLLLATLVGETGHVYSFDVQQQAIETTKQLIQQHGWNNVHYIHDSHAKLETYLQEEHKEKVRAAIFNLGYLPRSDKKVITEAPSTIAAMEALLHNLKKGGRVVLVVYHGHVGGKEEKDAVLQFVTNLDQQYYGVLQYGFVNQRNNPPFVIAIEKRQ